MLEAHDVRTQILQTGWLSGRDQVGRMAYEDFLRGARRPRFAYEPPEGWRGAELGGAIEWRPTDPARAARLLVLPAALRGERDHAVIEELLAGQLGAFQSEGPAPLRTREGLRGNVWCLTVLPVNGAAHYCDIVVLEDERYLYPVRMQSRVEQHVGDLADLFDVVHTVRAIGAHAR